MSRSTLRMIVINMTWLILTGGLLPFAAIAADMEVPEPKCVAVSASQSLTLTDAVIQSLSNEPHLILAREDVAESKADLKAARTPFLPKGQLIVDDERFVPSNAAAPVTVVGNNILGGTRTYSAYGSVSVSWNILSSGRDMAGFRAAQAGVRASDAALYGQLDDTLSGLLKAYADVYEARLTVDQQSKAVDRLRAIESRSEQRFRQGDGTTIAVGQARSAALDAERTLNQTCSGLTEKSLALAKAIGVQLPAGELLLATSELPALAAAVVDSSDPTAAVENDPEVISAKEKVTEAEAGLRQTHAAFGPSIEIDARRDYLGQDVDSLSLANHAIAPNSYRVGVSLIQPLFSFTTESSAIDKARVALRKAQVSTNQARGDADAKLRTAIAAQVEADASYRAAQSSVTEAQQVVELTVSLYKAGRTDMDSVEHAELDLEKVQTEFRTMASHRLLANWDVARAFQATRFAYALLHQLGIEFPDALPN